MSSSHSRQRQLVYLAGILVLMVPIVVLGMPTSESGGALGQIAQKRVQDGLGEPSLGNVDPASATMNLVLLGLRGIATDLLWLQADKQKEQKNWSELNSTVESIILLQPHFKAVWSYQAWNLGYNVSAECDAVEDRYFWVKRGMKFIIRGTQRNDRVPELYFDAGEYFGNKIGRSDEKVKFRQFFRRDPDEEQFGGDPDRSVNPDDKDNYLVAKDWYQEANDRVEQEGIEQHRMAEHLFLAYPMRSQMNYATALQDEGRFGDISREAWATANREWTEIYGRMEFDTPGGLVTFEANETELAQLAEDEDKGFTLKDKLFWQQQYQNMAGYRFWKLRTNVERDPTMAEARSDYVRGRALFRDDQDLEGAKETLYSALTKWQAMADKYRREDGTSQLLTDESDLLTDTVKTILIWRHVLSLLGEEVPAEFPMDEVWTNPENEALIQSTTNDFNRWQGAAAP